MSSGRPFYFVDDKLHCDEFALQPVAERFGTPLYVYSARQIVDRARLFQSAFATVPHSVCYAVKANSSLAILRLLAEAGCGFDIVSGGELERVIAAAGPAAAQRVVFSGVGKSPAEMERALAADILLFNVESEGELEALAARAEALGKPAPIALRVNPNVSAATHPYISTGLSAHKFGISIDLARAVYARAAANPWLKVVGVSVHIGSQIREVDPFSEAVARTLNLIQDLRLDGHDIRFVDVGGGLGIEYTAADFDPADAVAEYAAALLSLLTPADGLHLLLEPGRFLVAQAGALVTQVVYRKRNGSKQFVIVDAAMNDLIRPALYQAHHEIVPLEQHGAPVETVDIVGPVCESGDFFARDRLLPQAAPGSLLAILDAGAYGLSLSSNYNTRLRPAEVLIEASGARLIRRRETYEELFAPELV